jgi:hypothetical protein
VKDDRRKLIEMRRKKVVSVRKIKVFPVLISLVFGLIQVSLIFSPQPVNAQDQEDPDFIVTLALMAVADDRLDGVMDTSALANLRAVVDEYYTQQGYAQMDTATASALNDQRQLILSALDQKIKNQQTLTYRAQVGLFAAMVDSTDQRYQNDNGTWGDPYDIYNGALSSGYEPDPRLMDLLQQRLAEGTQSTVQTALDGNVAATIPGGDQVVAQTTDTLYDFSAGMASGVQEPEEIVPKPLIFINGGNREVRVLIEYYEPPIGLSASAPGMNVQIAGGSTVVLDGFPQGNYVFCFDWETDMDRDNDGFKDYDRAVVHTWISSAQEEDFSLARTIKVAASFSETPLGRCDGFKGEAPQTETVMVELAETESDPQHWVAVIEPTVGDDLQSNGEGDDAAQSPGGTGSTDQDEGDEGDNPQPPSSGATPGDDGGTGGLTAAEVSNQGTHNYTMTCMNEGLSDTRSFSATWEFTSDGVLLNGEAFYNRVSENVYQNEYGTIITFFSGGYLADSFYTEISSEGQTTTSQTNCTANIQ